MSRGRVGPTLILFCLLLLHRLSAASVYDVLPKYGLPPGLLPAAVKSYELSESDGRFSVVLEKACYVEFEYLVYYEEKITGRLSYGAIRELKGIQVKKLFVWLGVDEIKVDLPPSGSIYFQVGFINKRLDLEQFNTVHSCRDNSCALQEVFVKVDNMTNESNKIKALSSVAGLAGSDMETKEVTVRGLVHEDAVKRKLERDMGGRVELVSARFMARPLSSSAIFCRFFRRI